MHTEEETSVQEDQAIPSTVDQNSSKGKLAFAFLNILTLVFLVVVAPTATSTPTPSEAAQMISRVEAAERSQEKMLARVEKLETDLAAERDLGKFLQGQLETVLAEKIPNLAEKLSQYKKVLNLVENKLS